MQCRLNQFFACFMAMLVVCSLPTNAAAQNQFSIAVDESVREEPVSGRVLLMLSNTRRFRPGENGTPIFGMTADDLQPGTAAILDQSALGHPVRSLADLPAGDYWVQAYLHVYTTFHRADGHVIKLPMDQGEGQNWRRSPGNLFSQPQRITFDPDTDGTIPIRLDQVIPPIDAIADTKWVRRITIESKLLSEFWGQPMQIGATVLLPRGFDDEQDMRYPVVYMQGHFSSRAPNGFREGNNEFFRTWTSEDFPKMLLVTIQHACPYYDDSYGVNSPNIGPYGDAIVHELMPEVEKRFRAISQPYARLQTGGSTGGWISLAQQVWYPDHFGGVWSFFPDQVDFRSYQVVNILEDNNAYFIEHEWSRTPRPGMRRTDGNIIYTMEDECLYEEVIGTRCRSGGQWAIWNAVFAPVADDGYPAPIWDPITGKINRDVAEWARDNFDIRHRLETNWHTLGPQVAGKIHMYCGRMDNYYLEQAVYRLEQFLEGTTDPYYAGSFEYGDTAGHGWNPLGRIGLLRVMADHIRENTPAGADTRWYGD